MKVSSPEDLDGAPQVEDEEDHRPVLHLLQAAENHEENHVPASHLGGRRGGGKNALGWTDGRMKDGQKQTCVTWIIAGKNPVLTRPRRGFTTSSTAII